jgi:hypothetical protein
MSGWSNGIADFDNDGWKDLLVARGNVHDNIAKMSLLKYEEPPQSSATRGTANFRT